MRREIGLVLVSLTTVAALCGVGQRTLTADLRAHDAAVSSNAPETPELPPPLTVDGKVVGKPVHPEPGELCLVCDQPIDSEEVAYLVEGQRVALHRANCITALQSDARRWLARLKTRGAFLGAVPAHPPPSFVIFFASLYVLVGLIFGALSAQRAFHTGYRPLAWFGLGFLFNVAAYLVLRSCPGRDLRAPAGVPAGLRKIASTFSPQPCPQCGAANHPSASKCGDCGAKLHPHIRSEVEKAGLKKA